MTNKTTNDKERIDAIPRGAHVLGVDAEGRTHLFALGHPLDIWVVDPDGGECLHHEEIYQQSLLDWAMFVGERCGWDVRHGIEKAPGEDLFDPEPVPPTREEVLA